MDFDVENALVDSVADLRSDFEDLHMLFHDLEADLSFLEEQHRSLLGYIKSQNRLIAMILTRLGVDLDADSETSEDGN